MLLAAALKQKKDLLDEIVSIKDRISNNATIQDGQSADEDATNLIEMLESKMSEVSDLTKKIEYTNGVTIVEDNKSINDLLSDLQSYRSLRNFYETLSKKIASRGFRYSSTDIAIISTVDAKSLRNKIDSLSKLIRQTDNKIQSINWTTELINK